jgi:uncharacterized protein
MNEHPNTALMRRAYDAFAAQDIDTLKELIDDDAVWHQPGHSPLAGDYRGQAAILDYFLQLFTVSEGTFASEAIDILGDDDRVMVMAHSTGSRGDRRLDTRDVLVSAVRDGKFVDTQVFLCDVDQHDAFWAE